VPSLAISVIRQTFAFCPADDTELIAAILKYLVDQLYDMLASVAAKRKNVIVVDVRNVVGGRWNGELHPKAAASKDIAARFISVFDPPPSS
jgi:hypothetical protein